MSHMRIAPKRVLILVVAYGFIAAACSKHRLSESTDIEMTRSAEPGGLNAVVTIHVSKPMVVGFFSSGTAGDEHLDWGIEVTTACARPKGVAVQEVAADKLVFVDGDKRSELSIPEDGNDGLGCYLVAPGRQPKIVRGTIAPSYLTMACPAAAASYFDIPACCPKGGRCLADGTFVPEGKVNDS